MPYTAANAGGLYKRDKQAESTEISMASKEPARLNSSTFGQKLINIRSFFAVTKLAMMVLAGLFSFSRLAA